MGQKLLYLKKHLTVKAVSHPKRDFLGKFCHFLCLRLKAGTNEQYSAKWKRKQAAKELRIPVFVKTNNIPVRVKCIIYTFTGTEKSLEVCITKTAISQ